MAEDSLARYEIWHPFWVLPWGRWNPGVPPCCQGILKCEVCCSWLNRDMARQPGKQEVIPLSWNEIHHNTIRFTKEWAGERREEAEGKTFWDEFFNVFGIRRRTVASFEEPVKNIRGQYSFIDLFWSGVLIVEHKSFGKDLGKAESQAFRYLQDLAREGRAKESPRYLIVSDFARIFAIARNPSRASVSGWNTYFRSTKNSPPP